MVTGPLESDDRPTPIISGYIALIRVFICVIDTLDTSFPGPPSYYRMSHGGVAAGILGSEHQHPPPEEKSQLEALLQILTRLDLVLSNLPEPLQLRRDPGQERKAVDAKVDDERRPQFDIMRTNIHITAIYFQSLILEMCLSQPNPADLPDETGATQAGRQLWKIKESVAGELLDILNCSSPAVLEANGYSMVRADADIVCVILVLYTDMVSRLERSGRSQLRSWMTQGVL